MILTLRIDLRKVIPARFVYKDALLAHLCLDFLDVIEIPGESGVYVGERDCRNLGNDLVRGKPRSCQVTMSSTRTRWPARRALPPQTPGVLTIRSLVELSMTKVYPSTGPSQSSRVRAANGSIGNLQRLRNERARRDQRNA
jgi:hypothetical protein